MSHPHPAGPSAADLLGTVPAGSRWAPPQNPSLDPGSVTAVHTAHTPPPAGKEPGSGALTPSSPPFSDAGWSLGTRTGVHGSVTAPGPAGTVTASGAADVGADAGAVTVTGGTNTDGTSTVRSLSGTLAGVSGYAGGEFGLTVPGGQHTPGQATLAVHGAAAVRADGTLGTATIANPDRTDPETAPPGGGGRVSTSGPHVGGEAGAELDDTLTVPLGVAAGSPTLHATAGVHAGVTGSAAAGGAAALTPRGGDTIGVDVTVPVRGADLDVVAGYTIEHDWVSGVRTDNAFLRVGGRGDAPSAEVDWNPGDGGVRVKARFRLDGGASGGGHGSGHTTAPSGAGPRAGAVVDVVPDDLRRLAGLHAQRGGALSAAAGELAAAAPAPAATGHARAAGAITAYLDQHARALHQHARDDADRGARVQAAATAYRRADDEASAELLGLLGAARDG